MYLTFYGFRQKPFSLTPDPGFLFMTPGHREALAQLRYGIAENEGFVVLIGEVGTGKTTLLRALRRHLDGTAAVAFVFNSTLTFDEILEYMLEEFGVGKTPGGQAQRIVALNNFLIERRRSGQKAVVIFDESQNLGPSTLEKIRMLSNFETDSAKLLQIVLAGQPELKSKLESRQLRQLRQRISLCCEIAPLSPGETRQYIRARLRIAGASDLTLFTDAAVSRIARATGGIPRLVNIMCDRCLVIGYADQKRQIDAGIARQAVRDLARLSGDRWTARPAHGQRWSLSFRWVVGALGAGLLGLAASLIGVLTAP